MFTGGHRNERRSKEVIRLLQVILPALLVLYGLLVRLHLVSASHYLSDTLFSMIALGLMIFATVQWLLSRSSARYDSLLRIVYFTLLLVYLLFVSGFSSPFVVGFLVLSLVMHALYGSSRARLSIAILILAAVIDTLYWSQASWQLVAHDLMAITVVIVNAVVLIKIVRSQDVSRHELSRSHAQESLERERLQTLINNMADAVISTDVHGVIRLYNAASLNLLDTNESLLERRVSDALPLRNMDDQPIDVFLELSQAKSVIVRDDLYLALSETENVRLELTWSPIRSTFKGRTKGEEQSGFIMILRDITKQKSLEEERDEFISVVSHELRTPITIVEGTLSNTQLMMSRGAVDEKTLRTQVDTAHEQVIYLSKMVNDLSTLSRAERGVADAPEDIDVLDMMHELYRQYEEEAHTKGLQFNLEVDPQLGRISVSRLYIEELMQNFITNAIKYTTAGSIVMSAKKQDQDIVFSVKDSGIGMSKTDQRHIFEKFYRAEDYRTRETNGTGLGLYVAAKLARKIGTTIELQSRLNHGSTFSFRIPHS